MEGVKVNGVKCPKCGGEYFYPPSVERSMYICVSEINGKMCDHTQCLCKQCGVIRDETEFGKHGDAWECKECGTVCWPYTDRMRGKEKLEKYIKKSDSVLNDVLKFLYK